MSKDTGFGGLYDKKRRKSSYLKLPSALTEPPLEGNTVKIQ